MSDETSTLRDALRYSHIGLTMVVIGGLCFWAGFLADDYFGWSPWGMLGGLFLGIMAAMAYFVNQMRQLSRELEEQKESNDHGDV